MARLTTSARQYVRSALVHILAADLAHGVATNLFTKLPNGVVPLSLSTVIVTPFNPGTSMLVDIGHAANDVAADPNAFVAAADFEAVANTRVVGTGLPAIINDSTGGLQITATATIVGAAPTEGEAILVITYLEDGVELFSQG